MSGTTNATLSSMSTGWVIKTGTNLFILGFEQIFWIFSPLTNKENTVEIEAEYTYRTKN